ncbi:MAG: 50S ribosomal protein L18 [Phycisphaerales bacterium]|nr:50S ribosomal protein L18 [Phycisphaerales bacterium]MDP6311834.1 50S ribosomal protein L18 [Phycisphaerales bacterium]MDP7086362.1 50S ribosomal protein L18 [Phycisphaerales bacterium]MDP7189352.1 50S ribosomal protein L18 [Phycisphaerales bacterium]MDP7519972.1 50S ribosomal protein L18 [Phycisphaerales bacterium]
MKRNEQRIIRRTRRRKGIRSSIFGMPDRPRLTVFRSSKHVYAQVIDDLSGRTLAAASTMEKDAKSSYGGNVAAAGEVGKRLAERAVAAGVGSVVFDRNGFKYHGRVKSLADGAREGGLKF